MASVKDEIDEKILKCSLCLNTLSEPKCLPCIHTFCKECIKMHIQHTSSRGMFHCPECRETVWVQAGGVDAYRTNFFINRLKDMKFNTVRKKDEGLPCRVHPDKTITLFCDQCNVCVCSDCIPQQHNAHSTLSLTEARKDREKTMTHRLTDLETAVNAAKDSLQTQKQKVDTIRQNQADVSDAMKAATKKLVEAIQDLCTKTIRNLGDVTVPVLEDHVTYSDELKTYIDQMESDTAKINLAAKKSSDAEMLDAYKDTIDRMSNICTKDFGNKEETLNKSTVRLKISYNEQFVKFTNQCKELVHQTKKDLTDEPSQSKHSELKIPKLRRSFRGRSKPSVSEMGRTAPKLGKKAGKIGRPNNETPTISGLCVHVKTGHVYCCVADKAYRYGGFPKKWRDIHSKLNIGKDAVCDVQETGEFVLFSVRSEGHNPCKIVKYNSDSSTSEVIRLSFVSELPGLFVCKNRDILVTNFRRGLIHRLSWSGESLGSFGAGALQKPWYVCQTSTGSIIVSDAGKSDCFIQELDGRLFKSLKEESDNPLCDPYTVRVDKYDRVYVACCWSNCVIVFSPTGDFLNTLISPDHGIIHPVSLCLIEDKIYIGHKDGIASYHIS